MEEEHMRGIPIERRKQMGDNPIGRRNTGGYLDFPLTKREEETDGRYSSWKKEHMIHIPKRGGN